MAWKASPSGVTSCWSTSRSVASEMVSIWSGDITTTSGRPGEREALVERLGGQGGRDLGQARPTAAQEDAAGQEIAAGQLLHDQLDAGRPDPHVVGDDRGHLVAVVDGHAPCVVDLERLGSREREVEPVGQALGERAATEGEHPGPLDAALADQRHVRRPAADVDEQRAGLADLVAAQDARDGVRLGHDLEQLEVQLRRDALERAEVDQRREGVEDPDLDVTALEADRVGQRVAVDGRARHRGVHEPDVDVRQAGLPGDRPLGLVERLALDGVDQALELGLGDRLVGLLALLAVGRGEALDQLAGDPDDDLGRPEAGHLLGFLEGDGAVVHDRGDVGDRARLHVRQALPLAADAPDRAVARWVDVEDQRLGELGADVEGRAGGQRLAGVALPDPTPEGHQAPVSRRDRIAASASAKPSRRVPRPCAIPGLPPPRPSSAGMAAVTRSPAETPALDEVVGDRHEQLRLVGVEAERDDARAEGAADVAGRRLERIHRFERERGRDQPDAGRDFCGRGGELAGLRAGRRRRPP